MFKIKDPKLIQLLLIGLPVLFFILIASSFTYLSEKIFLLVLLIFITRRIVGNLEQIQPNKFKSKGYNNLVALFGLLWTLGCLFYCVWGNLLVDRKINGFKLYGAVVTFCFDECSVDLIEFGLWNNTVVEKGSFPNEECLKILISEKEMLNPGYGKPLILEKGKPYLHRDCGEN